MSGFAQILQHEYHEQRKTQLGGALLVAVIAFVMVALGRYL